MSKNKKQTTNKKKEETVKTKNNSSNSQKNNNKANDKTNNKVNNKINDKGKKIEEKKSSNPKGNEKVTAADSKTKAKEEKKAKESTRELLNNTSIGSSNEMSKLVKIVLIVTGIMIIFYGITLIATNQADKASSDNQSDEEKAATEIQYENIMIGTMLNHGGTYYVLIEQKDDNRTAEYESIITTIESSEDAPTIYKANLTDSFNKVYLGKEQNYYVDNIADFRVTGTVLVTVVDGKIDSVKDNYDDIKNQLNDLV